MSLQTLKKYVKLQNFPIFVEISEKISFIRGSLINIGSLSLFINKWTNNSKETVV